MIAKFKILVFLLLGLLTGSRGRRALLRVLHGYDVHPSARIGLALIDSKRASFGPESKVGHFTVIRNLEELVLAQDARIGTFNWIYGARGTRHFKKEGDRLSKLILQRGASVTSRHLIDCTDTVEIGAFSTVAGFRTQILTHAIDIGACRQSCDPVQIGSYCFIGTGCIILKGSAFPDRSVLSAGSVFAGPGEGACRLYRGNPAKAVRAISEDSAYMVRTEPRVE